MRLEDGGTLLLEASWAAHRADGDQFGATLYGTEGGAEWIVDDYAPVGSLKLFGDEDGTATVERLRAERRRQAPRRSSQEFVDDGPLGRLGGPRRLRRGPARPHRRRLLPVRAREEREINVS